MAISILSPDGLRSNDVRDGIARHDLGGKFAAVQLDVTLGCPSASRFGT